MIPEREREALMRMTMCARLECGMCKYKDACDFDFQYEFATENMNILADALRKTENMSEIPTGSTSSKMEQVEPPHICDTCKHSNSENEEDVCYSCSKYYIDCYEPKDEPQTNLVLPSDSEAHKYNVRLAIEEERLKL